MKDTLSGSSKAYLLIAGASTFFGLVLIAMVNILVDPYGLFGMLSGRVELSGKPEFWRNALAGKAAAVREVEPEALILGASRAMVGLDPQHPCWDFQPVYNLGLEGPRLYEIRRYYEHARAVNRPKQIVLALDFFTFNAHYSPVTDFSDRRLASGSSSWMASHAYVPDLVRAAISWGALVSSFRTIRSDDEALFRDDGFRVRGWRPGELRGDVNSNMQIVFGAQLRRLTDLTWLPAPDRQFVFDDVDAGSSTFDELAMILRHAYEDGSDLRMFISPVHAQVLETFRELGLMEQYFEWQRRLVDVSEREARIQGKPAFPILDFSGYNRITTERVPGAGDRPVEMNGYLDPSHFSRATGSLILDAVLGCRNSALAEEEGVAVLLNSTSIEGHIANTRRAGTAYRLQNSSVKR